MKVPPEFVQLPEILISFAPATSAELVFRAMSPFISNVFVYRTDDVDVYCGADGVYLGDLEPAEWVTYTVHIPTSGAYRIDARYAAAAGDGTIRFAFGGTDVTEDVSLPSTGGMSTWSTATVADSASLEAGVQAMRVVIGGASSAFNLDSISISAG